VEAAADESNQEASETASSSAPSVPEFGLGDSGTYTAVDSADESAKTKIQVTFKAIEYVTPAAIDTTNKPEHGQYVIVTLMVKNVGDAPGSFAAYGAMKWQDETTAAQDCTSLESSGGVDLDTTYQPGESLTGDVVLDIAHPGGSVSYFDDAGEPAFIIRLPAK
jgi:hypothetical protein